ncbi:6-phosphogluconolactonase [Rhizobium sp. KAs_5_22]|uniref:6-phosphogluconolactonase n=1 Tax=Ciceribacter selenitireducens TaxID=448181 RepID=UPI00048FA0A8|nr:6-phosphogluconolactonase [Ciceribacter selenitireducens]PPJ47764.1 6-phosphogluconolactonase [Rhizobium sp. KAs_5_22]
MAHKMHAFEDRAALAAALADRVSAELQAAITSRGSASLAVSGGSTPKQFFEALSTRPIAWDRVVVTLVDERFVGPDNTRSNHLLVRTHLLQNAAAKADFVPLYHPVASAEEAAELTTAEIATFGKPFDVTILGMGNDGHTASFFPGGNHLAEALDRSTPRRVMTMEAEGAGEPRLTLSFSALCDSRLLVIHIEGAEKKAVLDKALSGTDEAEMPVRAVLERSKTAPDIYWAP